MSFFKSLKAKLLGSIKEDLNSALGSRRVSFNSKISGALDDLIAMKTGINISNVPEGITEEALLAAEARKAVEKLDLHPEKGFGTCTPKEREQLRFPTSDHRYVDNWIIFRTVPRPLTDLGAGVAGVKTDNRDYGVAAGGIPASEQKGKYKDKFIGMSKDYTIAMYFPTGVRDNVSVDYEAKEVGLSDIALDSLLNAEFGTLLDAAGGAFGETFQKAKQAAVAFSAFESGVVVDNPKFNTFQGVGFRDHSYSFTLYPYNETDAEEITKIVHTFKMMMLPMSSSRNRRVQIMPAEWSINFQGPILGHIEHPQNCFLKSCDVDYSGGKDMSFIEGFTKGTAAVEDNPETDANESVPATAAKIQHYPNGINVNLVFQEILNLDRLRYVQRVAASAMGASQDVREELNQFEKQVNGETTDDISKTDELYERTFLSEQEAREFMVNNIPSHGDFEVLPHPGNNPEGETLMGKWADLEGRIADAIDFRDGPTAEEYAAGYKRYYGVGNRYIIRRKAGT